MKKIKFALLPAFLVGIVGAFAAQGSKEVKLTQYYTKDPVTGACNTTLCQPIPNGATCTGQFYNTRTALGECKDLNTATFRRP